MRIQPRQHLLDIWRATARASYSPESGDWLWGGREPANSISDAEQLLCIMLPATEIPRFRLDRPNRADDEVIRSLRHLGDAIDIPRLLVRVMIDYLEKYTRSDGSPDFSGGSYFSPAEVDDKPEDKQVNLDVVEGFTSSISLMLAALGFVKVFRSEVERIDIRSDLNKLEGLANQRLSAAMVGLVRSFTINAFDMESVSGRALLRTVNQDRRNPRRVTEELQESLQDIAAGLRDLNVGVEQVEGLDRPGRLFECGWSWGITKGAPVVGGFDSAGVQRDGYALDAPYLYFTVVALDAIAELFSERTRRLGLLNDDHQKLASTLRLRFDLVQQYWATIASFGVGRWPLEDIPWRTIDEKESDYYSLLVTSIAARDLAVRRDTDTDLSRLGRVLIELANRGRITRRAFEDDPAIRLHEPGVAIDLEGTETMGPPLTWVASDYAPLLLKRVIFVASQINDIEMRAELLALADSVWDHIAERRMTDGAGARLWDQPKGAYRTVTRLFEQPSWHHTVRVVESLVFAATMAGSAPLRSEPLALLVKDLVAEAEHLLDRELLEGSAQSGRALRDKIEEARQRVVRSREIMADRPGSAVALLLSVLRELDDLEAARPAVLGDA
jgi:hypothetical protein